jgi:hypothetical protein
MQELDDFLKKLNPTPIPKEEELRRVKLQIDGMHHTALKLAEAKYPGFESMLMWLHEKEIALDQELNPTVVELKLCEPVKDTA